MPETLSQFFERVTGKQILPYQERYGKDPFVSTLMIIPTGLGKTDSVIVPWLFAHAQASSGRTTRLVIVLPRQNLTEQTARVARERIEKAELRERVRVLELMGGSEDNSETLGPDEPAIIICTQDMYLSRALNRGYARRPPRWPIDFALLNNDCLVVFDEVQLMSDGLATTTQLAAMREEWGVFGQVPCVWMSATVHPKWLDTVDFKDTRPRLRQIKLEAEDEKTDIVQKRYRAKKVIERAPDECRVPEGCARFAVSQHKPRQLTLIITNTVGRAREIHNEVKRHSSGALLLHSQFRPSDRKQHLQRLEAMPPEGQIVVSTQVLEAGIDISCSTLITDLAPWGSLVQRFGRANRYGEFPRGAQIWWVDQPLRNKVRADEPEKLFAPYDPATVQHAMDKLRSLASASPSDLPKEDGSKPWRNVLRRSDLLDLFDTSPDLSGNEIDVSRFIRSGEERDVYLAWRDWEGDYPGKNVPELQDAELCPVPLTEIREFAKKHAVYKWDFTASRWQRVAKDKLFPGMLLVTGAANGGYLSHEGWSADSKVRVPLVETQREGGPDGDSSDKLSFQRFRQSLRDHTEMVVAELQHLLNRSEGLYLEAFRRELIRAAALHDWGKAHRIMQQTLHGGEIGEEVLAKSAQKGRHEVPHFRHELASALAMLATGESDLSAYVAAAHHGKVRISIRSMPGEVHAQRTRGLNRDGDVLPGVQLTADIQVPQVVLSLDCVKLGTSEGELSWTDRMLRLRDEHGPFRLAYLEMLLRSADERASAANPLEVPVCQ